MFFVEQCIVLHERVRDFKEIISFDGFAFLLFVCVCKFFFCSKRKR
jgi:hypothetical protein